MPEARERTAPEGGQKITVTAQRCPLPDRSAPGPGLTSSSAFGSVAQGQAGRLETERTRGPWNTGGRALARVRICRESPLGGRGRAVRRRTRPIPRDARQTLDPQANGKNGQGGVRLARTPLSVSSAAAFGLSEPRSCPPQRSSPERAAHKVQGDHDPRCARRLGTRRRARHWIRKARIAGCGAKAARLPEPRAR